MHFIIATIHHKHKYVLSFHWFVGTNRQMMQYK